MYYRQKLKIPQPDCYLGKQYQGYDVVPLSNMIYDKYSIRAKHHIACSGKTDSRIMKHLWMLFCRKNIGMQAIQRITKKGYFYAYFTNTHDLDIFLCAHGSNVTEIQGVHDAVHASKVADYTISYHQRKPYYGKYDIKLEFFSWADLFWNRRSQAAAMNDNSFQQLLNFIDQLGDYKINLRYVSSHRYDFIIYTNNQYWQEIQPFIKLSLGTDNNLQLYTTYTTNYD